MANCYWPQEVFWPARKTHVAANRSFTVEEAKLRAYRSSRATCRRSAGSSVTGSFRDAGRQSSPSVRSRPESDGALRGRGARIVGLPGPELCRLARVPPTISQTLGHGFLRDQTPNPALLGVAAPLLA